MRGVNMNQQIPSTPGRWVGTCRRWLLLGACALVAAGAARAEDIDIYAGANQSADKPNVLFIWDNSANWGANVSGAPNCYYKDAGVLTADGPSPQGKKFSIEKCALYNAIDALPVAADGAALFNVGVMLMNEPNNDGVVAAQGCLQRAAGPASSPGALHRVPVHRTKGS